MTNDRIISVGLLSQRDLDTLGQGFTRHFPVDHENVFAEVLNRLDLVQATHPQEGLALRSGNR